MTLSPSSGPENTEKRSGVTAAQVRWFRLQRSNLNLDPGQPATVAAGLMGVQAQILTAAALALGWRCPGLTLAGVEDALYGDRTLVKLWGQRGTIHLYARDDWPLLVGAQAGELSIWARRIEKQGGDLAAYQAHVRALADHLRAGPLTRQDLRALRLPLEASWTSSWGGIFFDVVLSGTACHGKPAGSEAVFVHRQNWLPDLRWDPPDREAANLALARRYVRAFGPVTVQDLAYWRGRPMKEIRRWWSALARELRPVDMPWGRGWLLAEDEALLRQAPPPASEWPVRLVYRFDPYVISHQDKDWLVPRRFYGAVWRPGGHIEGCLLVRGQIAGVWRYDRPSIGLVVTIRPFRPLSLAVRRQLPPLAERAAAFFARPLAALVLEDPLEPR